MPSLEHTEYSRGPARGNGWAKPCSRHHCPSGTQLSAAGAAGAAETSAGAAVERGVLGACAFGALVINPVLSIVTGVGLSLDQSGARPLRATGPLAQPATRSRSSPATGLSGCNTVSILPKVEVDSSVLTSRLTRWTDPQELTGGKQHSRPMPVSPATHVSSARNSDNRR